MKIVQKNTWKLNQLKLLDGSSWNCLFSYSTVDFAFQEIPFLLSCPLINVANLFEFC